MCVYVVALDLDVSRVSAETGRTESTRVWSAAISGPPMSWLPPFSQCRGAPTPDGGRGITRRNEAAEMHGGVVLGLTECPAGLLISFKAKLIDGAKRLIRPPTRGR